MPNLDQAFDLTFSRIAAPSELVMSDRLISLAQDAERGGYSDTAARLVLLAHTVFDDRALSRRLLS